LKRPGGDGRLLGLVAASFLYCGCGVDDLCGNKVLARVTAPAGQHVAVVFERDCGATTGFSTQVSILDTGATFRERPSFFHATVAGNALSIDDAHGELSSGPGGAPEVVVQWTDEAHVTLTYDPRARVFHAPARAGGVAVRHVRAASVSELRPDLTGSPETHPASVGRAPKERRDGER
jgi:hypothetical protein